jgi:3-dehydroquinate dehydratase-2
MTKRIIVINGPNLNMLGTRQPDVYGKTTLAELDEACRKRAAQFGATVDCLQSNDESAIVDAIQQARGRYDAIVINAAAFSHTSIAILDALLAAGLPVVEVHLSNIHRREAFRHHSYVTRAAVGIIAGFGPAGYELAIEAAVRAVDQQAATGAAATV